MIEIAVIIIGIAINYLVFDRDYRFLSNLFNTGLCLMLVTTKYSNIVMAIGMFLGIMFLIKTIYDVKEGK